MGMRAGPRSGHGKDDPDAAFKKTGTRARLALVSSPWPFFDRPSIQLGSLKGFLKKVLPDVAVDTYHLYLKIAQILGYDLYQGISTRLWVAECPYAALLYPHRIETVHRFWRRKTREDSRLSSIDFITLCDKIRTVSGSLLEKTSWDRYDLVGFSICLDQLSSSLYFIREIKKRAPHVPIVAGGSSCAGEMGKSLLQVVPEVDYVIQGEGEIPLSKLIRFMTGHRHSASHSSSITGTPAEKASLNSHSNVPDLPGGAHLKGSWPDIPGLMSGNPKRGRANSQQIRDLDELPIPDYTDYFCDLTSLDPDHRFLPRLPMEISRGCWWRKRSHEPNEKGCAFCNLNLQWEGYRRKSADRVISEIDALVKRHQVLNISFMDNLLPARGLETLFSGIEHLGVDLKLFSEIRADTSHQVLRKMAAAGMREVQVGVEALSTRLLKKLNKGTTAMDNLEIMKHCEHPDMPDLTGNLILEFPSSDSEDVAETLRNLDFAFPFRPLKGIPLWLGYGSTVWRHPDRYGMRLTGNHRNYGYLFPEAIRQKICFMMQGYHGGVRYQHRLWAPVREKITQWHAFYDDVHKKAGFCPVLWYQDGKDFLIIHQRRLNMADMTHRLKGSSRGIYRFCARQRALAEIVARFPRFGEDQITAFLRMMVGKRLMFKEKDRFLSLAIRR